MPSELRKHLATLDELLARRADMLWEVIARPLHDAQTGPDENIGGALHVGTVEDNVWRLLSESGRLSDYSRFDLFVLSCAACTHDFDKALNEKWRQHFGHGAGSGRFVVENLQKLGFDLAEAVAVDYLDSLHDLRGDRFMKELGKIPHDYGMAGTTLDLQRLAVVLKAADTLHTDESRISSLGVDRADLSERERSKHDARSAITGWGINGTRITLDAYPHDHQVDPVHVAFHMIQEEDWRPIARELQHYGLPHELKLRVSTRYRTETLPSSAPSRPPEMDHYAEADAAYFAGRDQEINELLTLVLAHPAARLIGPSGVGKSSLLHAGLLPAARQLQGWRFIVTRPDRAAGRFFTAADFPASGTSAGCAPDEFLSACRCALSGFEKVLVIFDQFEDIGYFGTFDAERITAELHAAQRAMGEEALRYLFAYRDDVESALGRLWGLFSHSTQPLPTCYLQRLSREQAHAALLRLLEQSNLRLADGDRALPWLLDELVAATRRESSLGLDLVYPPFIQMVAHRLTDLAHEGVADIEELKTQATPDRSAVDVVIAEYLERSVAELDRCPAPSHYSAGAISAQRGRAVLLALAHSSGTKAAAREDQLAAEARIPSAELPPLLQGLAGRRLIRRLPDGQWEIIHDLLARRILETCDSPAVRHFKQAREALQSRARTFRDHHALLTLPELHDLWLGRDRLPPATLTTDERMLLLVSMYDGLGFVWTRPFLGRRDVVRAVTTCRQAPGWYWLSNLEPCQFDELLGATYASAVLRARRTSVVLAHFRGSGNLPWLREALRDQDFYVPRFAAAAIGMLLTGDELPWLREALKDDNRYVRQAAVQAIGKLGTPNDLLLLRRALKDDDLDVRQAAAEAIGKLGTRDDLPSLREVVKDAGSGVVRATAEAIGRLGTRDDLPWLCQALRSGDVGVNWAAVEAIAKLATRDDLPWLDGMMKDRDWYVRLGAVTAIGKLVTPDDPPWLREAMRDNGWYVRQAAVEAFGKLGTRDDLPWLREAIKDNDWEFRHAAVQAIGKLGTRDDLPRLREAMKDDNCYVRQAAVEAIGKLGTHDDLPWLRGALTNDDANVCASACRAVEQIVQSTAPPAPDWFGDALCDSGHYISTAAAETVGRLCPREQILGFLAENQQRMTTGSLGMLDWFLYAPAYLREALEAELAAAESE